MKRARFLYLLLTIIVATNLLGCNIANSALIKVGVRNEDFEYIKQSEVDKIVIQSSRDPGFRFVVTDSNAKNDIYEILRQGKVIGEKTSLQPDYILEVYIGEETKQYKYIVNLDERGVGNFYDEDKVYLISKNLDETIIQNLSFTRKPKDFQEVYYSSILEVLKNKTDLNVDNNIAIDISGDVDCLKYMLSVDLLEFQNKAKEVISNISLIDTGESTEGFDTVIIVKNKGYNTKVFKTIIIVNNQKDKIYETYYVKGNYENKKWNIKVSEPNVVPDNW